jgi:AcrR family transcriptional regulator
MAATRKDAVRNRALLVDAAAAAFREGGLSVSVNAIARLAGVNVATLYRHFPTKDELVAAVLDEVLEPLASARDRALATAGDGETLAVFLREAVRLQAKHQGLIDALVQQGAGLEVRDRLRGPAIEIVMPLVERAHRHGELRADFNAIDVLVALRMVAIVAVENLDAGRYVDVVLRGLRPD